MNKANLTAAERMDICKRCPLYSSRYGGICNNKLYYNPKTKDIKGTYSPGYINGCGCMLKSKTESRQASCPADKW